MKVENIPYFKREQTVDSVAKYTLTEHDTILAVAISEFHVFYLRTESITIVNTISQRLVEHKVFGKEGDIVTPGTTHDGSLAFNVARDKTFYKLAVEVEGNDSWQLFLEKKNLQVAYDLSKKYRPEFNNQVGGALAMQTFEAGRYKEAATLFSQIDVPFERVVLLYMDKIDTQLDAQAGLITVLTNKMGTLKGDDKSIERKVIAAWMFEQVVYRYSQYSDFLEMKKNEPNLMTPVPVTSDTVIYYKELLDRLVSIYKAYLDEKTCIQILQSHGRFKECLELAEKFGKYEEIILNYLNEKNYKAAVDRILKYIEYLSMDRLKASSENEVKEKDQYILQMFEFLLKNSKNIILNDGQGYLKVLNEILYKSFFELLDNTKIIQIVNYLMELQEPKIIMEAKSFLEALIRQLKDLNAEESEYLKSISNIIIYLLSKVGSSQYLEDYLTEMENAKQIDFDINFAMLLCQQSSNLQRCEIILYGIMGLYEEAVSLALYRNQFDLAKLYASKPEAKMVKTQLWVKIAKKQMRSSTELVKLLNENKDMIKIEDLIPYFGDNVSISTFKEQISESLVRFNDEISDFKSTMNQTSKNLEFLKKEVSELRNRYFIIDQDKKCEFCGSSIFTDVFYYFPCGHAYLKRCMRELLKKEGQEEKLAKLEYFENGIRDIVLRRTERSRQGADSPNKGSSLRNQQDELQTLNDLYVS